MPDPDPNRPSANEREPKKQGEGLSTADLASRAPETARPADEARSFDERPADVDAEEGRPSQLFDPREVDELRRNWTDIQAGFVDEPRSAVENADQLVALTMKRLAEMFAKEREGLESQWDRGDRVSTEDLRIALRRYRSFFDRLLNV
jgi:hypothetical protein